VCFFSLLLGFFFLGDPCNSESGEWGFGGNEIESHFFLQEIFAMVPLLEPTEVLALSSTLLLMFLNLH
jgi:hypothetical protein